MFDKFPFRIHTIQTDNGHEFQANFHWHLLDLDLHHRYIKPRSPKHNGKVERSHRTDKMEFYQLLNYVDNVDLNKKLAQWVHFYNYARPHSAMHGKTPYERLIEKMRSYVYVSEGYESHSHNLSSKKFPKWVVGCA